MRVLSWGWAAAAVTPPGRGRNRSVICAVGGLLADVCCGVRRLCAGRRWSGGTSVELLLECDNRYIEQCNSSSSSFSRRSSSKNRDEHGSGCTLFCCKVCVPSGLSNIRKGGEPSIAPHIRSLHYRSRTRSPLSQYPTLHGAAALIAAPDEPYQYSSMPSLFVPARCVPHRWKQ